ncbi:unnamed protein product [Phytomonas sp. Hart1]|nr:unnamed protein product [Phytomonas sp. Hart1]|eukprot:CCW68538.1 unnamed protein product [Phytomonas sp. isolate Hart1]
MAPKTWGKPSQPPPLPPTHAPLVAYIRSAIQANNGLGMPEAEIGGMVDLLLHAPTRAEIVEWTNTLLLGEAFAAEVIQRRLACGLPFEGEGIPTLSTPSAGAKSTGRVLTIPGKRKHPGGRRALAVKKGDSSSLKPGKFECGCFATVHPLRGNCANCGRIICEQEEDAVCYFCGLTPSLCVAYEIAVQEGKVTEAVQQSNQKSYEAAIARRDTLLEYASNRAKRTTVIDDQKASLFSPQSAWMTQEERLKQAKLLAQIEREKANERRHRHTGPYQVHIDFVNHNLTYGTLYTSGDVAAKLVKKEYAKCHAADGHSSESGLDTSEASGTEIETLPTIESRAEPLPSLLEKIWYSPGGSVSPKSDEAALSALNDRLLRRHEEVSKRVQQNYFEEDAQLFGVEALDVQPAELIFTPGIREGDMPGPDEEVHAPAAVVEAPPVRSLSSDAICFAPTPSMRLRDDGICLSIHQPWATLLIAGIKTQHGLVWRTNHRGRLWIHAATTKVSKVEEAEQRYAQFVPPGHVFPKHYPTGVLLGYVYLTECLDQGAYESALTPEKRQVNSPFVLICVEAKPLPFLLSMDGGYKLFTLDHKIQTAAKKQLMEIN